VKNHAGEGVPADRARPSLSEGLLFEKDMIPGALSCKKPPPAPHKELYGNTMLLRIIVSTRALHRPPRGPWRPARNLSTAGGRPSQALHSEPDTDSSFNRQAKSTGGQATSGTQRSGLTF
jgi:hypothetical protein